mmetsp:Transcript_22584/g.49289  ORF Transcript_22584/g.49289 Transcript_22584/m.49289 type:complete len:223 (+) Transcript_22584:900-1568(+)
MSPQSEFALPRLLFQFELFGFFLRLLNARIFLLLLSLLLLLLFVLKENILTFVVAEPHGNELLEFVREIGSWEMNLFFIFAIQWNTPSFTVQGQDLFEFFVAQQVGGRKGAVHVAGGRRIGTLSRTHPHPHPCNIAVVVEDQTGCSIVSRKVLKGELVLCGIFLASQSFFAALHIDQEAVPPPSIVMVLMMLLCPCTTIFFLIVEHNRTRRRGRFINRILNI